MNIPRPRIFLKRRYPRQLNRRCPNPLAQNRYLLRHRKRCNSHASNRVPRIGRGSCRLYGCPNSMKLLAGSNGLSLIEILYSVLEVVMELSQDVG